MPYTPRSIAQIQTQIIQNKQSQNALSSLTSTSQASYWNLWTFITAVAISLLEQIWAVLVNEIETDVANAVPGTIGWIQAQVLLFQYGNAIQINPNFTISYPTPSLPLIITSAAVQSSVTGALTVKVAKGGTSPTPLVTAEKTALTAYLNAILPAGQIPQIISVAGDGLLINANIYYNGQYNQVIIANVNAALSEYSELFQFNGLIKISDIEKAILGVTGVVDVVFTQITVTPAVGSVTNLVLASTVLARSYQTYSGYIASPITGTLTFNIANQ